MRKCSSTSRKHWALLAVADSGKVTGNPNQCTATCPAHQPVLGPVQPNSPGTCLSHAEAINTGFN